MSKLLTGSVHYYITIPAFCLINNQVHEHDLSTPAPAACYTCLQLNRIMRSESIHRVNDGSIDSKVQDTLAFVLSRSEGDGVVHTLISFYTKVETAFS